MDASQDFFWRWRIRPFWLFGHVYAPGKSLLILKQRTW
jgi:hypothetical protein